MNNRLAPPAWHVGQGLTFMLAASGVSLPEIVVLSRVLQPRLVLLFVGTTLALYTALGLGFVWL